MSAKADLEQIAQEVAVCTNCSLCKTRTRTVPGEGSPTARLLFIGEAPGYHEDQQGRPFVGNSGELLNKLLNAIKISRQDVFIANVVKCRPPNNQDPTEEQINACKPYLDRQIAAINPGVIVTLGRFSMRRFFPGALISRVHGQSKQENGRVILPMFHPAAALRDQTRRTMMMFKEDGLTIPSLLEQAEELARTELWGQVAEESPVAAGQPMLSHTAPPRLAETPGREVYAPSSVEVAPPTAPNNGNISPDQTPVPVVASSEVTTLPVAATSPKPPRTPRKPKAVEPVVKLEAELTTMPGLKAITRSRKKRPPADGEQLRMF